MRAVWSFWSRPFETHKYFIWHKPIHHLLAWGLSLRMASQHYPETILVTDYAGKKLLVDKLGLAFTHVSTELERLRDANSDWWALGKLVAYNVQDQPFVHLDTDVFLWKPLPRHLAQAPVFAQHPEYPFFHWIDDGGGPRDIENCFAAEGIELPVEWQWVRSRDENHFPEENCGIFGGTNIEFIRYYSNLAVDLVLNPQNRGAWARLSDKKGYNMIVEQFLLAACVAYHRFHPTAPYRGVKIRHLFPGVGEAFDQQWATRLGYTHLMGGAKSNPVVAERIETRSQREDPAFFRQCAAICS
jgi:hypothetical protein